MLAQKSMKRKKQLFACAISFNLTIIFFGTYVVLLMELTLVVVASLWDDTPKICAFQYSFPCSVPSLHELGPSLCDQQNSGEAILHDVWDHILRGLATSVLVSWNIHSWSPQHDRGSPTIWRPPCWREHTERPWDFTYSDFWPVPQPFESSPLSLCT